METVDDFEAQSSQVLAANKLPEPINIFRAVFNLCEQGILILVKKENEWVISDANPSFCRILGCSPKDLVGKTSAILKGFGFDVLPQDDQSKMKKLFRNKLESDFLVEWVTSEVGGQLLLSICYLTPSQVHVENNLEFENLLEQNKILNQKNSALLEILELVEIEKKKIKENISSNVESVVLPALGRIACRTNRERKYLGIIQENLKDLTTSFGGQVNLTRQRLSPRESEISNLVKDGQSNREIAAALKISVKTVETIRNKIRRKLGLVNKNVNLTSFFRNL